MSTGVPGLVSVIIPSVDDKLLELTVRDLLARATGDVEVIVVLDGYWAHVSQDPRVRTIHFGTNRGMRESINVGMRHARGEWLMKSDEHCLFAEGYDAVLREDCKDGTIVVPRRYALDGDKWDVQVRTDTKYPIDYCYPACPKSAEDESALASLTWNQRRDERGDLCVDRIPIWQGSSWIMKRSWWDTIGELDSARFGTFYSEALELAVNTEVHGGQILVTKRTWYAHYHRPSGDTKRPIQNTKLKTAQDAARYFLSHYAFHNLIERFSPLPGWPTDITTVRGLYV